MHCVCPTKNSAYACVDTMRCVSSPKRVLDGDPDPYDISPSEALGWIYDAWEEMPAEDIKKYWKHAGLFVDRTNRLLVAQRMSKYCQDGDAVFMMGDLNAIPTTAAVKYVANEMPLNGSYTTIPMNDSLTVAGAGIAAWIGNGFGNATWEPYKFDYIFTRDDPETCLQNASALVDLLDGYSSSDHAVPLSEFCLGSKCAKCIKP